jgi:hypothetical protein
MGENESYFTDIGNPEALGWFRSQILVDKYDF